MIRLYKAGLLLENDHGDVSSRIEFRNNMQCKSFQWYLDNIYPEHELPLSFKHIGQIRNVDTSLCIDTMGTKKTAETQPCHYQGGNQLWILTNLNEIKNDDDCIDGIAMNTALTLQKCHQQGGNQRWVYDDKVRR